LWAGLGIVATTALDSCQVAGRDHRREPMESLAHAGRRQGSSAGTDQGPVLVTAEYRVSRDSSEAFLEAIHEYGRVRPSGWCLPVGVYRDLEDADRYVENVPH